MQITDVRVRKVAKEGKLKAVVSITIDDEFVVHDIKVIEGEKGMFIAMPSKKAMDGEYRDIAHPINSNTRERIQSMILEKYEPTLVLPASELRPAAKAALLAQEGAMAGIGARSPIIEGKIAVKTADAILDDGSYEEEVLIETFFINKENVEIYGTDGWQ